MKKIAIICNPLPQNKSTLGVADALARTLKSRSILFSLFTTYWPQVWDDYTEAWIIGGDGTLNYFINIYPHCRLPLSVFKSGSGNDFHWLLYGELTLNEQIEKVLNGAPHWIDAGECNGKLFINGIGIGFDGAILKDLLGKSKRAGKSSYLLAILKNIVHYKEEEYEVEVNGQSILQKCFMLSVANGKRYGGGFKVAPKAVVTDGLLDVNRVGMLAPLKRIFYLPVIEKGRHTTLPFVQYMQSSKVLIKSNTVVPAHADGEFFESTTFEIKCLPKRFRFIW